MIKVLMTILYIFLFILCLSILIVIHELGHFTTAKIFKVYVQEYSIGFGPALIHKKKKNGETYFSLRAIPFGGYVSMYGEGVELEDGVQVDESRSLEGIKKWKRAIILFAGVFMNAVLAITIFFMYNVTASKTTCYFNQASIRDESIAYNAGLRTEDVLAIDNYVYDNADSYQGDLHLIDVNSEITLNDSSVVPVFTYLNSSKFTNYKEENLKLEKFLAFYEAPVVEGTRKVDFSKERTIDANFVSLKLTLYSMSRDDNDQIVTTPHEMIVPRSESGGLTDIGYSLYLYTQKPMPFFKGLGHAFVDFGESSTVIVRALGTMFSKDTWNSMGGIVAIGFETTSVLQNFGWGRFFYIWGVLSVNLAIVNLLPFPGLDGWQLLVLAVEAIAHKKIPNKVKTIVSIVGLALLFTFMVVLLFKDIFTYIL